MILSTFIFLISFKLIFSVKARSPKRKSKELLIETSIQICMMNVNMITKTSCLLRYWFGLQQSEAVWINAYRQKQKN